MFNYCFLPIKNVYRALYESVLVQKYTHSHTYSHTPARHSIILGDLRKYILHTRIGVCVCVCAYVHVHICVVCVVHMLSSPSHISRSAICQKKKSENRRHGEIYNLKNQTYKSGFYLFLPESLSTISRQKGNFMGLFLIKFTHKERENEFINYVYKKWDL